MKSLIRKEFTLTLCSPSTIVFMVTFLLTMGLFIWFLPGEYNILAAGYASLSNFFYLSGIFFIVLIPALTMRSFSEEIKHKTIDIFRSRPKTILSLITSKLFSLWAIIFLLLVSTIVYVFSISLLSNPQGNIDLHEILSSYTCLFFLSLVFISVGLFSSSFTSNQIIAFIIAVLINFTLFYGYDLLATFASGARSQQVISSFGLNYHSELIKKGIIQLNTVALILSYVILFTILTLFVLLHKNKRTRISLLINVLILVSINILIGILPNYRFDFTSDKRYSISDYTVNELKQLHTTNASITVNVYLDGDLNPGFLRLQNSVKDILSRFEWYADNALVYRFVNPHTLSDNPQKIYEYMAERQMKGVVLNEVDREGKASQKLIYPYAQVISGNDTLQVNLLKNVAGYSAEENLNTSIENLEFAFVDAIRLLNKPEPESIAFIEGHGELSRPYVYDAEELLSKYYFVNRGQIGHDISILDGFKAIIIAGSTQRFSEAEKFILDQYIMSGGKVLWLIDGAYISDQDIREKGQSASMKNDINLDDMLFNYGIRINPDLLQDVQCANIYLTTGTETDNKAYIQQSWYYTPLLLPSLNHSVTKDISLVKSTFASSISVIGKSETVNTEVLLTTSANSHIVEVPEMIKVDLRDLKRDKDYFNQSYIPVAVSLQGSFKSAFENRFIPDSVNIGKREILKQSSNNVKMIVVSSSDIIRNELVGRDGQTQVLPMGFDKVSERQYGNRDFIVNAVNWLVADDNWLVLRNKTQQLRLLDKQKIYENSRLYAAINIIIPIAISSLFIGVFYLCRRRKYSK